MADARVESCCNITHSDTEANVSSSSSLLASSERQRLMNDTDVFNVATDFVLATFQTMVVNSETSSSSATTETSSVTYYGNCHATVLSGEWTVKDIMWGGIYGLLSFLTFAGNLVNLAVFGSRKMGASAFNTLLYGLALAEGLEGGVFFIELAVATYGPTECNQIALKAMSLIGDLAYYSAAWIITFVSVTRCIAVGAPTKFKELCTVRTARTSLWICVSLLVIEELPMWFNTFWYRFDPELQILEPIRQTFGRFLPIIFALISTVVSILLLSRRNTGAATTRKSKRAGEQQKMVRMLLVLLTVFFVCNGYAAVSIVLQATTDIDFKNYPALMWSVPIVFGINTSVNILVYFFMTPNYRGILLGFFCRSNAVAPAAVEDTIVSTAAGPAARSPANKQDTGQRREVNDTSASG